MTRKLDELRRLAESVRKNMDSIEAADMPALSLSVLASVVVDLIEHVAALEQREDDQQPDYPPAPAFGRVEIEPGVWAPALGPPPAEQRPERPATLPERVLAQAEPEAEALWPSEECACGHKGVMHFGATGRPNPNGCDICECAAFRPPAPEPPAELGTRALAAVRRAGLHITDTALEWEQGEREAQRDAAGYDNE